MVNQTTGLFYGWWIVLLTIVAQIFAMGSTVIGFGLFIKPVGDELELSRATMNAGLVMWMVGFALGSPFVGKMVDKLPTRKVMAGGAVMLAAGFAILSQLSSPLFMGLILIFIIGPGSAALGPMSSPKLVTNWFLRHSSKALGLSAVGASAGGVILVPILAFLIDSVGWRMTLLVETAMFLVIVCPLIWLFVVTSPEERGLHMDGEPQPPASTNETSTAATPRWGFAELSKTPTFWMLVVGLGMMAVVGQALLPTLIPFATDAGIDIKTASLVVSFWSAGAVSGKLVLGYLGDTHNKFTLFIVLYLIIIAVSVVLLGSPGPYLLFVAAIFGGSATGGFLPLMNGILAQQYGRESLGTVIGFLNPVMMLMSMVGVWYIGSSYDTHGNYISAIQTFIGLMVFAAVIVFLVKRGGTSAADKVPA